MPVMILSFEGALRQPECQLLAKYPQHTQSRHDRLDMPDLLVRDTFAVDQQSGMC